MLKKFFTTSIFALAISLPAAFATPIANNTSTAVAVNATGMVGTKVADTGVMSFTSSQFVSGTLQQQVYREDSGTLDFYYLVTNDASSIDGIARLTTTNFAGFTTDVSYLTTPAGGTAPTGANRSPAGNTIGFEFQVGGINVLNPNHSSAWLEISTNATEFNFNGISSVIDGGAANLTTYSPVATPEPMSMSLLGAGLAGFGLIGLRRRAAKK